uniref:Neurotransmitter-gated ion-channel ligand-binding domain-containing protein n=1 Tax=Panagrolaimus sp. ES5 TaxID=591445 RepID=A0AC34F0M5_9BILA
MVTRERRKNLNDNNNEEEGPCCSCWQSVTEQQLPLIEKQKTASKRPIFRSSSMIRIPSPITLFITFIICGIFKLAESSPQQWEQGSGPNTTYISQVLNRLTDRSKYDKRLRPLYGENPVDVGITIHVSSISAVSEVDMDFTLDFYLRQTWQDPRLAFGKLDIGFEKIKSLTVGVDYLDRLWKPDTFFPNEKKSFFHVATTHNSFLRIEPDGRVSKF